MTNARQVTLEELFENTEVLSLHTPQTDLTKHMINASFLEQFEHNIYLINTARGSAVVTKDLVKCIGNRKSSWSLS